MTLMQAALEADAERLGALAGLERDLDRSLLLAVQATEMADTASTTGALLRRRPAKPSHRRDDSQRERPPAGPRTRSERKDHRRQREPRRRHAVRGGDEPPDRTLGHDQCPPSARVGTRRHRVRHRRHARPGLLRRVRRRRRRRGDTDRASPLHRPPRPRSATSPSARMAGASSPRPATAGPGSHPSSRCGT